MPSNSTIQSGAGPKREAGRPFAGRLTILLLVCTAQFMLLIDDTIVNVALPSIGNDMRLGESSMSWITNAYLLTFGGFLLIGGRVADMYGRRRVFMFSMAAFFIASVMCGVAASPEMLVISRGLQGLAGAFMSPAALSILLATFTADRERTRALAAWTALTALGAATGLLLGGTLTELLDWRWIFWINLPVGLVTLASTVRAIPADRAAGRAAAPAVGGAAMITGALLTLVFTVVETGSHGWGSPRTVAGLALAAALAAGFVARERRATAPLVPRSVIGRPHIALADTYMFLAAGALLAMFFFLTLYMQRVLGYKPIKTGLAYLPFSVTLGIVSGVTTKLLERFSAITFMAIGPAVAAIGLYLMSRLGATSDYGSGLLPALVLVAAGYGLAFVPLLGLATADVPERDSGIASGLVTSSQQIGGAIGIAVLVTIAANVTGDRLARGADRAIALVDGFQAAFVVQVAVVLAMVVVAAALAVVGRDVARVSAQPAAA